MLLFSDPMSGFRVPPGNLTVTLPYQVPARNPNDTLYEQFRSSASISTRTPLGESSAAHAGSTHSNREQRSASRPIRIWA